MMWGTHKENGIWFAQVPRWFWSWRGGDSLYICAGRMRIRIMKAWMQD